MFRQKQSTFHYKSQKTAFNDISYIEIGVFGGVFLRSNLGSEHSDRRATSCKYFLAVLHQDVILGVLGHPGGLKSL